MKSSRRVSQFLSLLQIFILIGIYNGSEAKSLNDDLGGKSSEDCTRLVPLVSPLEKINLSDVINHVDLYESIKFVAEPKDEFETTAQWQDRQVRRWHNTEVNGRHVNENLMVMAPILPMQLEYNADEQVAHIRFLLGTGSRIPQEVRFPSHDLHDDVQLFTLSYVTEDTHSYTDNSSHGISKEIQYDRISKYRLAMTNIIGSFWGCSQDVSFSAPPFRARDLQDKMAVIVRIDLEWPYVIEYWTESEQNNDFPRRVNLTRKVIVGRVLDVYIVEENSGDVIAAYQPEQP